MAGMGEGIASSPSISVEQRRRRGVAPCLGRHALHSLDIFCLLRSLASVAALLYAAFLLPSAQPAALLRHCRLLLTILAWNGGQDGFPERRDAALVLARLLLGSWHLRHGGTSRAALPCCASLVAAARNVSSHIPSFPGGDMAGGLAAGCLHLYSITTFTCHSSGDCRRDGA